MSNNNDITTPRWALFGREVLPITAISALLAAGLVVAAIVYPTTGLQEIAWLYYAGSIWYLGAALLLLHKKKAGWAMYLFPLLAACAAGILYLISAHNLPDARTLISCLLILPAYGKTRRVLEIAPIHALAITIGLIVGACIALPALVIMIMSGHVC